MAAVLKTARAGDSPRGFESLTLRSPVKAAPDQRGCPWRADGRGIYAGREEPRLRRSASAQPSADALIGYLLVAVDAVSVDAQEHIHAVTGPAGDGRRGDASVQPERRRRVPQVVWSASQRGPGLLESEREGPRGPPYLRVGR